MTPPSPTDAGSRAAHLRQTARRDRNLVLGILFGLVALCGGGGLALAGVAAYLPDLLAQRAELAIAPEPVGEPFVYEGRLVVLRHATIREETTYDSRGFPQSLPHQPELRALLHGGEYARLNDILERYQREAEADFHMESWITLALGAFDTREPSTEASLNAWVEAFPSSAVALMCRGEYYRGMGIKVRGGEWTKDTSKEQLEWMRVEFRKAFADVNAAHQLNPRITTGYAILMQLAAPAGSEFGDEDEYFETALKVAPNSMWLRNAYMSRLRPRWGGSYEEMRAFADEAQSIADIDPRVRALYGWVPWDQARRTSDREERIELCTQALSYGERSSYYRTRASAYRKLKRYDEALADYSRAVEIWPLDTISWGRKIELLVAAGRMADARRELATAQDVHPDSSRIRRARTRLLHAEAGG